jgi:protein-tyrosine phosphatase
MADAGRDGTGCPVVSDLGGAALPGGGRLRRGAVFRISGGLCGPGDLARLDELGLRVLVDLRGPDEDRSAWLAYCGSGTIAYRHCPIPVAGAAEVAEVLRHHADSADRARSFLAGTYRRVLDEFAPALATAVAALAEDQPAGFGCAAGKDRTGLVAALLQDLVGVDRATIVADYLTHAPHPKDLRRAMAAWWGIDSAELDRPGVAALLEADPHILEATLDYLDGRYGGTVAFLEAAGVAPATIETLRRQLMTDEADR